MAPSLLLCVLIVIGLSCVAGWSARPAAPRQTASALAAGMAQAQAQAPARRSAARATTTTTMVVENDAFRKANREMRKAGADERMVEIRMPMGLVLDEDRDGNVFVKEIDQGGRAAKTGKVFVGDRIAMVSATFGDDLWSCRGVGLTRVMSSIKVRNSKPVRLVLEAPNEAEEKKRRLIAFKELSADQKAAKAKKDDELLAAMLEEDKELFKKGVKKGFFGLF